jgi:peroxiredoxin
VHFPGDAEPAAPEGPYCFELIGGDTLYGSLVSLDDRQAVIQMKGLDALHIDRDVLQRISRTNAADLIFSGPHGLTGWETAGPANAWREEGSQLATDQAGATLRRQFRVPPQARYEIELSWLAAPTFEFALGMTDDPQSASRGFRFEVWEEQLVALRETSRQADLCTIQKLPAGAGRIHLQIYLDPEQGRLLVFSAAGEKLGDLTVPDDKSPPLPKLTKGQPQLLLKPRTGKPATPGGVQLVNRRNSVKLERLSISRWSGVIPQAVVARGSRMHLTNGSLLAAEVLSYDADARQFLISEQGQQRRLDADALQDIVLSPPREATPRSLRALRSSGSGISGDLLKIEGQHVWLKCPGVREPLVLPLRELRTLIVLQGDDVPEAQPGDGRLELAGVSLHGRLLDARAEDGACLVFRPRHGTQASPLARGVSGRLVYRDPPPPPKPEQSAQVRQAPAVRIVNGVRTLIGTRQSPPARIAQPSHCVLHLRSGDAVGCQVTSIDEGGVFIKSDSAEAGFVPHEQIKALELQPNAPPVKIEKTKKERLLMLPRLQRDNPPTQLIRSLEGDYLRGRLLAMDATKLQVELHLEAQTLPREQVARIIWLHADEVEGASPRERPADAPQGLRVQAVPRSGNRLTFVVERLERDILSGHSPVLGACRVNLAEVDQLLLGEAIEQSAATLAFHGWKLKPAPEPLPTPEGDAGGGEGLESVLVGKPAPEIDLELLEGKRFRLADHKGKIVLLDFWASWCGPCLQTMPQVEKVAAQFADQGVELVTINLQETPERVRTALERLKLEFPVALDKDGRVAERYGATSIPQTVIVDREGKVARLFVGGSPRFDEQLRQALVSVLAGAVGQPARLPGAGEPPALPTKTLE